MQNIYIFCILLLWGIVFGLRDFDCGNDSYMYHRFFSGEDVLGLGSYKIDSDSEEIGFTIIANLLHRISDDTTFFFLTTAIAAFLVIYPLYRNNSTGIWGLLCFFIMSASFSSYIIAMRQSISIILMFLGIYVLKFFTNSQNRLSKKVKKKKYMFAQIWCNKYFFIGIGLCLFAIFVHRTTILLLPLLFLAKLLKFNRRIATITVVSVFVLSVTFTSIIGDFFNVVLTYIGSFNDDNVNLLAERYKGNFSSEGITTLKLLSWCIPMLITVRVSNDKRLESFQFTCLMLGFILYILLGNSTMCIRISMMFQLIGFAMFVPENVNKNKKLYWLYLVFTLLYFYSAYQNYERWIVSPYDSTLPFRFFWE